MTTHNVVVKTWYENEEHNAEFVIGGHKVTHTVPETDTTGLFFNCWADCPVEDGAVMATTDTVEEPFMIGEIKKGEFCGLGVDWH